MGRGADEFFGCDVNSESPMGGFVEELGRAVPSRASDSCRIVQIACRDRDSCRRRGTNDHVLDDGIVTEIEYMYSDATSAGTESGTVLCSATARGSASVPMLDFISPEDGMQRLALLPNSISLAEPLLTPTDLVAFVGRKNGDEDVKRGRDDDVRACGHAAQGAVEGR